MAMHRAPTQTMPTLVPGGQGIYELSATQKARLGSKIQVDDREFVYVQYAATIGAGLLVQPTASADSNWEQDLVAHTAIPGTTVVTLLMTGGGNNALSTAGYYDEGYLFVSTSATATLQGYTYRIKKQLNTTADTTASPIAFELYDGIVTTIATADVCGLLRNPWKEVTTCVTNVGPALGVTPTFVSSTAAVSTSKPYGWLQRKGPCAVQCSSAALDAGSAVIPSVTSAGMVDAIDPQDACTTSTLTNAIASALEDVDRVMRRRVVGYAAADPGNAGLAAVVILDL